MAVRGMDVVTTSGRGTGIAANPERLREMARVIGGHALGLASGVTPENAHRYTPFVNAFLVASGIEKRFGELEYGRTAALAEIVHAA
jgi:predicted TIM-barrel enzyme